MIGSNVRTHFTSNVRLLRISNVTRPFTFPVFAKSSTIEDARERAAGIGDRVDEAVAPLTEAIAELSDRLAGFAELAALAGEDTGEPASERSLNPIELEGRAAERIVPVGDV